MEEKFDGLRQQLEGGVSPAMATPLLADGMTVDVDRVPQLVSFLLERGVSGLFVGGTTGEGILLSVPERQRLLEATLSAAAGKVPVLAHVGANTLSESDGLMAHALASGADVIVMMPPHFFKMDAESLLAYFKRAAGQAGERPFMVYDIPQLALNAITPELLFALEKEIPNFAGLKCSRTDMQLIRQLLDILDPRLLFLAGNEPIALGSLALGADGLISGLSTAVPEVFVALCQAHFSGNRAEARHIQRVINDLLACLPTGRRIGAIKQILHERGVPVGAAVPPRPMPEAPIWPHMQEILAAHQDLSAA